MKLEELFVCYDEEIGCNDIYLETEDEYICDTRIGSQALSAFGKREVKAWHVEINPIFPKSSIVITLKKEGTDEG